MSEVPHILLAIEGGDPKAAKQLLPLVYDELRRLAAHQLGHEKPGYTLQPTALVHEAYLRLIGGDPDRRWNGCGHFFAAAAESMRRILVEAARRKGRARHGGGRLRVELDTEVASSGEDDDDLLALDEALGRLAEIDPTAVRLVELRYFAGLTMSQAADALGVPLRSAERDWAYARAWLRRAVAGNDSLGPV
ncbi:MAG: ECF-type sigma factor [Gemmataceae bacterium]